MDTFWFRFRFFQIFTGKSAFKNTLLSIWKTLQVSYSINYLYFIHWNFDGKIALAVFLLSQVEKKPQIKSQVKRETRDFAQVFLQLVRVEKKMLNLPGSDEKVRRTKKNRIKNLTISK